MEPDRPPTGRPEETFSAGIRVAECIVYRRPPRDYAVNTLSIISGAGLHSVNLQLSSRRETNELQMRPTMQRTALNTLGQADSELYRTTVSRVSLSYEPSPWKHEMMAIMHVDWVLHHDRPSSMTNSAFLCFILEPFSAMRMTPPTVFSGPSPCLLD